jgi:hypothetical protein
MSEKQVKLNEFVVAYEEYLKSSFNDLWSKVPINPLELDSFSVVGGLLSRQVTLSMQLARSPATWNGHAAPLFLRSQTDLQITIAWILCDLVGRSRKYILHSLGEEKLNLEHHKKRLEDNPDLPDRDLMEKLIEAKSTWINQQRHDWLVEVNLGHWGDLNARSMSIEAGCEDLYHFAYKPFTQVAHSMWSHISVYNSRHCENSLHRAHLIPELVEIDIDPDYMYRSCKYVHKTYQSFIDVFKVELDGLMPLEWWNNFLEKTDTLPDEV